MQTSVDCAPCFVRQALEAARIATDDPAVHEEVVRRTCAEIASLDLSQSPPVTAQKIHRLVREFTGNPDPYLQIKERTNRQALQLLPSVRQRIRTAERPLEMAVRMALAGNIIDFGVELNSRNEAVDNVLERAATGELHGKTEAFVDDADRAESILYLADNSGEIVFDRALIEELGAHRVTVVVRGLPVLNDVLVADALAVGLDGNRLVGNGSDAPGTILEDCCPDLRRRFATADMVIAKGQGNYETLSAAGRPVWFLLMAKCPVIARDIGCPPGSFVITRS